jgi:flagellin
VIGGLASSLAVALRQADSAQRTMETMSRQIATGQRVSSVRDDGAAWTRAAVARADAGGNRAVANGIDWLRAGVGIHRASVESRLPLGQQSQANALRAMDPSMTAATRTQLDLEQIELSAQIADMSPTNHDDAISLRATSGSVWQPFGTNASDINISWLTDASGNMETTNWSAVTFQTATAMNSVASTAAASTTRANREVRNAEWATLAVNLAALVNRMGSQADLLRRGADRLEQLSSSLTDADLGRASSARAAADTRQQLALATIRQALNAYGTFAGGLLGNLQRTRNQIRA